MVIDQRPSLPSYASGRSDYCVRDSLPPLVPRRQCDSEGNPTCQPQQDDQAIVENTTVNAYPRYSSVTATCGSPAGRLSGRGENTSTRKERDIFVASLPTRVQVKLKQPFGKDNLTQCFKSQACSRHVMLPLYKSQFLDDDTDWETFALAIDRVWIFLVLVRDHAEVDC